MARFATQCLVLVVMDSLYLIFSLLSIGSFTGIYTANIVVISIKIFLMLVGYFYFKIIGKIPYRETNFLRKNMDVIYPMTHFILEFFLFITGPANISLFVRMCAVPFICGGIPIIKQLKAIVVETIIFLTTVLYLHFSHDFPTLDTLLAFVNIWLVVFVCANLISFIIYSASVQNFKLSMLESEAREKVEQMSNLDELTRINNRRMIVNYLDEEWNNKEANHASLSAIIFDIDHFKMLNDTYGHKKGDECLYKVANTAKQVADGFGYKLARYGGEEFLVVAFDKEHIETVELAEKIRKAIENLEIPNENSKVKDTVTASFGVSTQKVLSARHYDKILEWADECLYFAKNAGRNRVAHREDPRSNYRLFGENRKQNTAMGASHNVIEDFRVDYAFIYYKQRNIIKLSKAAMEILNLPEQIDAPAIDSIRKSIDIPDEDFDTFNKKLHDSLKRKAPTFSTEFRVRDKSGTFNWIAINAKCIYTSSNELEAIYGTVFNIEKLDDYHKYINKKQGFNPVTNLPGRPLFREKMSSVISDTKGEGYLLVFDIDDFKAINGFHGHIFGNEVLINVSNTIKELLHGEPDKDEEILYQFGPDQFAVIMENADKKQVSDFAKKVLEKYNYSDTIIKNEPIDFSLTSTALKFDSDAVLNELLIDIDISIQVAKENEPKDFSFFTEEKRNVFLDRVNLEKDLEKAVKKDFEGFVMYYQPLIDAKSNKCAGAEALLRWKNYSGELVPPLKVIPALNRINYLLPVEQWLIQESCKNCRSFIDAFNNEEFFVHINLVPELISRSSIIDEIKYAMKEHKLTHKNLFFEVLESASLEGERSTLERLNQIRNMGIKIAIDDFGTGFSSLSYLKTLPVDEIKIDSSFLKNCDSNKPTESLLHSIIDMTKKMGYEICIEGVESSSHYQFVMDENVDLYQGYYFSKPIPHEEFIEKYK